MKKTFILYCLLCTVLSLSAQHDTKIRELHFLVGKWNVESHLRLAAQGPWDTSKATSHIKMSLNGTVVEEDYTGAKQGKPFYIKTLFGYNNANGLLQQMFADSEHGVLLVFEGSRNNDTVYFDKTWTYANGNMVKLRKAFYKISGNEFLMESMRMPQGTTVWDVTTRMRYYRAAD